MPNKVNRFDMNVQKGNVLSRLEALEEAVRHFQTRGINLDVTNVEMGMTEIIMPAISGTTADPTDAAFTGVVISPNGQLIDGVLYNFALVENGVVVSGWGDDGGVVVVGGTGDVIGDTVPSVAGNAAIYTDTSGKHISDSGVKLDYTNDNLSVGPLTNSSNTTGVDNTAIGYGTLTSNTEGENNVALGKNSLGANVTGVDNIAVGASSMQENIDGGRNIAIGMGALRQSTTGDNNTAIGAGALGGASGDNNIAIGSDAGTNETGSNKLFIDSRDRVDDASGRAGAIIYGVMNVDPTLQ